MINYPLIWKKKCGMSEYSLKEFQEKFKSGEFIYQEKIDGVLSTFVYQKGKEAYLISINEKRLEGIKLIEEYREILDPSPIKEIVVVGDLLGLSDKMSPLSFYQSQSILKTPHKGDHGRRIAHFVYDIFQLDRKFLKYRDNLKLLHNLFNRSERIKIVNSLFGRAEEVDKIFHTLTNIHPQSVDGIIARYGEKIFKIKKTKTYDVVVIGIGFSPKLMARKEMSYLIIAFRDNSGRFFPTSRVGTGFNLTMRRFWYNYAIKNKLYENDRGEIFVRPKIVIEVKCLEVLKKDIFTYTFDERKKYYEKLGKKLGASLRFPVFIRIRDDKKPTPENVNLRQVI